MDSVKVSLDRLYVPVVGMKLPDSQPQIVVGFNPDSPLGGAAIVVGVGCTLPGHDGLFFAAHINAVEARQLASKILAGADQAEGEVGHA
jgi:hypothetical protein